MLKTLFQQNIVIIISNFKRMTPLEKERTQVIRIVLRQLQPLTKAIGVDLTRKVKYKIYVQSKNVNMKTQSDYIRMTNNLRLLSRNKRNFKNTILAFKSQLMSQQQARWLQLSVQRRYSSLRTIVINSSSNTRLSLRQRCAGIGSWQVTVNFETRVHSLMELRN